MTLLIRKHSLIRNLRTLGIALVGVAAVLHPGSGHAADLTKYTAIQPVKAVPSASKLTPVVESPTKALLYPSMNTLATALTTSASTLTDLEALDQSARDAQRLLMNSAPGSKASALQTWVDSEQRLGDALDDAWSSLRSGSGPVFINQPMALALLNLHVEARRFLGPDFGTAVPGLDADRGCAGDLIGERLLYRYGAAAASPLASLQPTGEEAPQALARIATQLACLGASQSASLEHAVSVGFDQVAARMQSHGQHALVIPLMRLLAPVQVLILDANKHRGASSTTWRWFDAYAGILRDEVAASGWASGELFLWDRRMGRLVGIPSCMGGIGTRECVEIDHFIDSLSDPRALGMGDCGFSGMVARGLETIAGDDRYACPKDPCQSENSGEQTQCGPFESCTSASLSFGGQDYGRTQTLSQNLFQGPSPDNGVGGLEQRWPQLEESDLSAMAGICRGVEDPLGSFQDAEDCLDFDVNSNVSPFDTWAGCIADVAGGDPEVGAEMHGVPTGPQCAFSDGAATPSSTPSTPPPAEPECNWFCGLVNALAEFFTGGGTATATAATEGVGSVPTAQVPTGGVGAAAGVVIGMELQLLDPDLGPEAVKGAMTGALNLALKRAFQEGRIDVSQFAIGDEALRNGDTDRVQQILNGANGTQDCFDPTACSNDCSALGKQLNEVTACTEQLMSDVLEAAGISDPNEIDRHLDWVSYPNPEDEDYGDGSEFGICFGDTGPIRISPACGLVLCSDQMLADGLGDGCGCDTVTPVSLERMCLTVRCVDGQFPDPETCSCGPVETYDIEPKGPGPMDLSKDAGVLEKDKTTGFPTEPIVDLRNDPYGLRRSRMRVEGASTSNAEIKQRQMLYFEREYRIWAFSMPTAF